jgi:hypothetical protein
MKDDDKSIFRFAGWFLAVILMALLIASMTKCSAKKPLVGLDGYTESGSPEKLIIKNNSGNIAIIVSHGNQDTVYVTTFKGDTLMMKITNRDTL